MALDNNYGDKYNNWHPGNDEYYCNAEATNNFECLSLVKQLLACRRFQDRWPVCWAKPTAEQNDTSHRMDIYEKHSEETLIRIWHIQCTIVVTLMAIALARVVVRHTLGRHRKEEGNDRNSGGTGMVSWCKVYILEFLVISMPAVVSVNVFNRYVEHILAIAVIVMLAVVWRSRCTQRAKERIFEFGRRPVIFTLLRSTISLLTVLCILAIDFESFPKKFRKTRRYGAGLMDVGIGLFVFSMALVSPRSKRFTDIRKMCFTVACMLILGLARTIVITSIDYHQDEHEYGKHLNAFFTLGLTKLFATLLGYVAGKDRHLLPLGIAISPVILSTIAINRSLAEEGDTTSKRNTLAVKNSSV